MRWISISVVGFLLFFEQEFIIWRNPPYLKLFFYPASRNFATTSNLTIENAMKKITDSEFLEALRLKSGNGGNVLDTLQNTMQTLEEVSGQLAASEAMQSHFLSNVRNEINNPIAAILGITGTLLKNENIDRTKIFSMLRVVYQEALYLTYQWRTIVIAAEIEAGELDLQMAKQDILLIIRESMGQLQDLIDEKELCVIFAREDQSPEHLYFKTDEEKFRLIVHHLLRNAIEFSQTGGKITLDAEQDEHGIILSIKDEGVGMDFSVKKELFKRFKSRGAQGKTSLRGLGLGLTVIKSLVDVMQGVISIESEKGEGSLFMVTLPNPVIPFSSETIFENDEDVELF